MEYRNLPPDGRIGPIEVNKSQSGYRWVVFGTVLLAYFIIVSQRTAPGIITDQLMKDFHVSSSAIGLMSSVQFLAYAGFQIPVGLLADRYGPNRFLILGALLNGLGSIIFSIAPNEYILISSRFLVGIGDSLIFINFVLILNQWFKANEFVKLLGLVGLAAGLGSLSATIPLSFWISIAGWRIPFFNVGIILVGLSYLLYAVLISKPKLIFKNNADKSKAKMRVNSSKKSESIGEILHRTVSARQAWATFLCHFGVVGTYVGFIGSWGVPYGIHVLGLSRSGASQLIMYGLLGAMIGGPFIGWITSRLSSIKRIYSLVHIMVMCSWMGLFLSGVKPPYITAVVLFFTVGFGYGASSLTFAVVRESFPAEEVGVVSGFANMGGFISAVLLPSIFGNVLDLFSQHNIYSGYHYGFIIPVLFSMLGLLGTILIEQEKMIFN